jgi:hypothetical protein
MSTINPTSVGSGSNGDVRGVSGNDALSLIQTRSLFLRLGVFAFLAGVLCMFVGCGTPGLTAPVLCPDPPVDHEHTYECEGVAVTEEELTAVCPPPVRCRTDTHGTRVAVCLVAEVRNGTSVVGFRGIECSDGDVLLSQDFVDIR